ncbi:MAG: ArsR family transcriptional regulator [Candidatus Sumerlaeia bacterium]|nr:ArsR family transcriptional regulator [Candidatus Sumerlaeia bacterium]
MHAPALSRLFKVLSDPTRLRLLHLMALEELSVMELAEVTQLAQSRVSNHLKVLREEGLIEERREGAWRHYRVEAERLPEGPRRLWDSIRAAWEADDAALADQRRLEAVLARRTAREGRFFETIADRWDAVRAELFGDTIGRLVLRPFVPADAVVADLGCGTGYAFELFGDRPRRLIAIDSSPAMLAVARRKVKALGLRNVEFREGDAEAPPLKAGEASVATLLMVLHHLEEPARALAAVGRALRPGGCVLIADFAAHQQTWLRETMQHRWLGFSRPALEEMLGAAGLRTTSWSVMPGRSWVTEESRRVQVPDGFVCTATK